MERKKTKWKLRYSGKNPDKYMNIYFYKVKKRKNIGEFTNNWRNWMIILLILEIDIYDKEFKNFNGNMNEKC